MPERTSPKWGPRRLYLRIYLAVLGIVGGLMLAFTIAWHVHSDPRKFGQILGAFGTGLDRELQAELSPSLLKGGLSVWAERMNADLAVYGANGHVLATAGQHSWPGRINGTETGEYTLGLSGARTLVIRPRPGARAMPGTAGTFAVFALVAVIVGLGCLPLVRGLTRRLEQLQHGVEAWDGGDRLPRLTVDGRDEIAGLANSFNDAAERIEGLIESQKSLLANASHELRSPLTRIRMATQLLAAHASPELREELVRNIGELDVLIDEILLTSRLDALDSTALHREPMHLDDLAREVADGARIIVSHDLAIIEGDPRLLARLIRNLVENAKKYSPGGIVEVELSSSDSGHHIEVRDRGPGVPAHERERIFEPFYRAVGASENDGGVGLGLSLVRQIAQLHGGHVRCLPRAGGGTCFTVWLPR